MRQLTSRLKQLNSLYCWAQAPKADALAVAGNLVHDRQLSSLHASSSGSSSQYAWGALTLPLLGVALASTAFADSKKAPEKDGFSLLPLATRQRIFFKYEKRIRDKSTLDKVFEYFSSTEKDQQKYLTPQDLVRAVVPTYPPSESQLTRSGFLDGERTAGLPEPTWNKAQATFFTLFDVDGDGLISYPEFLLLLTLLSIREKDVQTVFDVVDLDDTGDIDRAEFQAVMELLQAKAQVHASRIGRSHKISYESDSGLLVSFFGKEGDKRLSLPQFREFLARLHEEVVRLEFAHYDTADRGSILAVDFARSLVATADVRHVDRLLDKVDSMKPELARRRISYEDFLAVHRLQRRLHTLVVALDFLQQVGRPLSRDDFSKLVTKLLGMTLSGPVIDLVFNLFSDGPEGALDTPAFLEVMQRREIMWARRGMADVDIPRISGRLRKSFACFKSCISPEDE